jgi:FMN-dependent oxidoreductase (nitrilotriacetate monooxygenase family)
MHLAMDLSFAHTDQRWTNEEWSKYRYYGPEYYQEVARTASRGVFDMLFFGDAAETPENHGGNHDSAVKVGFRWPKHDMMPMVPLMASVAEGVGFGLTMSTTYHNPFHVARLFSSLDWVTGGRVGWNAVTSAYKNEGANWGYDVLPRPEERYRKAREHIGVVTALWDTVEPDAVLLDREAGRFGDPSKVHLLHHRGEYFSVRGPLPALPSPQGRPILIQAGQSPPGMDLAATYADMQFVHRGSPASMAEHRATLDRLLIEHGRSPRSLGVWWALTVVVGETHADAVALRRRQIEAVGPDYGMLSLSATFGTDFSTLDPDMTLQEAGEIVRSQRGHWGTFDDMIQNADDSLTVAELAAEYIDMEPRLIGSPVEIADRLEELHELTDANGGFILEPARDVLTELAQFADLVVPELQRRALVKTEYAGSTLRANLEA